MFCWGIHDTLFAICLSPPALSVSMGVSSRINPLFKTTSSPMRRSGAAGQALTGSMQDPAVDLRDLQPDELGTKGLWAAETPEASLRRRWAWAGVSAHAVEATLERRRTSCGERRIGTDWLELAGSTWTRETNGRRRSTSLLQHASAANGPWDRPALHEQRSRRRGSPKEWPSRGRAWWRVGAPPPMWDRGPALDPPCQELTNAKGKRRTTS